MAPSDSLSSHDHTSKRKRDADDNGSHDRIPQPPPPQSGNGALINYLTRSSGKMQLVQGDAEVFTDVLGLMSDYEAVLSRQESLAANLGAKLTGPKLVNAMERLFEGPITLAEVDPRTARGPVSWLDIVQFAKANPSEFVLTTTEHGRVCSFYLNGNMVEITEDDWRMIVNGTLDRFNLAPSQPLEEDEDLELATVEILNERLQILIKKADEVARKARQLNYHLSGRKAAINSRRASTLSPQTHHPSFTAHNQPPRTQTSRSNSTYDLKSDLLRQFATTSSSLTRPGSSRLAQNSVSLPTTPIIQQGQPATSSSRPTIQPIHVSRASPAASAEPQQQPKSATKAAAATDDDDPSSIHKPLITARIEKLAKGESIIPPCDRCRRLRTDCIKHLTACQGCTKKHAKCAWKTVTDDEVAALMGHGGETEADNASVESRSGGGYTPDPQSAASSGTSVVETRTFASTPAPTMPSATTVAVQQQHSTSNGAYGRGFGSDTKPGSSGAQHRPHQQVPPIKERFQPEFGMREPNTSTIHRSPGGVVGHRVDHSRLSHMASVALSGEQREREREREHARERDREREQQREPHYAMQDVRAGGTGGSVPVE